MNKFIPQNQNSATKSLFSEYLSGSNKTILEQLEKYKKIADIYERTQIALGRKVSFKSTNCTTDKVKINLNGIGSTHKI